jgi:hypothetical protein
MLRLAENGLFISPNLLSKQDLKLRDEERVNDLNFIFEYRDVDTVNIAIPKGFVPEAVPQATEFSNKFGKYQIKYTIEDNKISVTRLFERKAGHFPATDYKELVKMYGEMYKADRGKVVLIKKRDNV